MVLAARAFVGSQAQPPPQHQHCRQKQQQLHRFTSLPVIDVAPLINPSLVRR
jgi:hypothetical protein